MARNLFADEPVQERPAGINLFAKQPLEANQPDSQDAAANITDSGIDESTKDLSFLDQLSNQVVDPSLEVLNSGPVQSALQGATLGFSDEIQSFISAAAQSPFIEDKTFTQLMLDARKTLRANNEAFKKENPATALSLEVAGGLATGGLGVARTVVGQGLKQATARGLASGATIGTAAGAGFADEEDFFSQETLTEGLKTGAITASLGGLTPTIIKGAVSAGKLIPEALPESLLQTALKFRPSIDQATRLRMTRTALDEGIMPTSKGLEQISSKLTNLDARLNKIVDDATDRGVLIPKKALFVELKSLRKGLGGVNIRAGENIKQIDNIVAGFDQQLKKIGKSKLTPREVQDLKRNAYKQLKFDVSQQSARFAETEAEKGIIRGAKKSLESIDPNVVKINRREGDLLQLGDELEQVVSRLDNRNLISLDTAVKVTAGTATGSPVGAAAGVGAAVLGAPRVKARTALILENIRKNAETLDGAKNLAPELLSAFSILVEDKKDLLNGLIDE